MCLDSIKSALKRGVRPAISLPTGSGKTRIFSALIGQVKPRFPEDSPVRQKSLILVNRKELLDQAMRHVSSVNTSLKVKSIQGNSGYDKEFDVFLTTYQTLKRNENLYSLDPKVFKLIVIDEAHHAAANSYLKILDYFEAIGPRKLPPNISEESCTTENTNSSSNSNRIIPIRPDHPDRRVHVVGFSATLWRQDQKILGDAFDEVCFHENVETLIKNGYLCPAYLQKIQLPKNYLKINPDARGTPFTHPSGLELIYQAWKDNPQCASTVIYGCTIAQITRLANLFRENGVEARIIHGKLKIDERERILADFSEGLFPVLLNCQLLTEGTDIPRIDQIIIARKLASTGLAMQIIGRGLRLFPGKSFLNVIVFPAFHSFDHDLLLPRLEKLVYERFNQRGISVSDETDIKSDAIMPSYSESSSEKEEFSTMSLSSRKLPDRPENSQLLWCLYNKKYYLFTIDGSGRNYFVVNYVKKSGQWHFASIFRSSSKKLGRRELFASQSLSDVINYADRFIVETKPVDAKAIARRSHWMMKPATNKQLEALKEATALLRDTNITRGVAWQFLNFKSIGFHLTSKLIDTVLSLMEPGNESENEVLGSIPTCIASSSNFSSRRLVRSRR